MRLYEHIAMIKRVIAKIRRMDMMLKDLCNEWRITWRFKKMDKTEIGGLSWNGFGLWI